MARKILLGGRRQQPPETLEHEYERWRDHMVERQIRRRGLTDPRVLAAMREVPRHLFVPAGDRDLSYDDHALPLGHGQTISQPYIVAFMAASLKLTDGCKVLEVGAGSGYQAAVLAACGAQVFGIERIPQLFDTAREALEDSGYADRVQLRLGDGARGWVEEAPFDGVLISAATGEVPEALISQLGTDGRLVAPIGGAGSQQISRYTKHEEGTLKEERLIGARFVPLVTDIT
jgi:protein-L-isoaspartate(D-aspartate) O-methyltransferase